MSEEEAEDEAGAPPRPQFVDSPYHLVTYPASCFPADDSAEDVVIHIAKLASFWMLFIERVRRFGENPWPLAEGIVKRSILERDRILERLDMVERARAIQESKSGFLSESAVFERLQQLREVHRALDDLNLAAMPAWMAEEDQESEDGRTSIGTAASRRAIRSLNALLYDDLLPLALASLWLWKSRERFRERSEQTEEVIELIHQLWIAILRLGAIVQTEGVDDSEVQSAFVPHVILNGRVLVDESRAIVDYTVSEFYGALIEYKDAVSVLCHGQRTEDYFNLLWLRLAELVSCIYGADVHDDPRMRAEMKSREKTAGPVMYRPNDRFFEETERIFYYLTEAEWAARWFSWHELEAESRQPLPVGVDSKTWRDAAEHILASGFSDFIKMDFDQRIWERNGQWDSIEEYERRTRTIEGDHRRATLDAYQSRFDIIRDASYGSIVVLWHPASKSAAEELELYERTGGGRLGYRWRAIWEISEQSDQKKSASADSNIEHLADFPYDVHKPSGEQGVRHFVHRQTGKRLRDTEAKAAAVLYMRLSTIAGKCEYDGLNEAIFSICISKATTEAEEKDGARAKEYIHYWPRLLDMARERFNLHGMLSHSHPLVKQFHPRNIAFLRVFGNYIIFDGNVVSCTTARFEEALACWCTSMERVILLELEALAIGIEGATDNDGSPIYDAIDKLSKKARSIVMRIPPLFRAAFNLERDPETLLSENPAIAAQSRHWTDASIGGRMRELGLWPIVDQEIDMDDILGTRRDRIVAKVNTDVLW